MYESCHRTVAGLQRKTQSVEEKRRGRIKIFFIVAEPRFSYAKVLISFDETCINL
jgi:hypothetical protein